MLGGTSSFCGGLRDRLATGGSQPFALESEAHGKQTGPVSFPPGVNLQDWDGRLFLLYYTEPKVAEKMGQRREPRRLIEMPVRIFGTDSGGKIFSENVTTVDVSQSGAKLGGVQASVKVEEIIGVTQGSNKVHFRVKWVGERGSPKEGQIGLLNLTPEKPFWGLTLPSGASDNFLFAGNDRRQSVRVKCSISVELHPVRQSVIWGRASDLSEGGCFVEMPIPLDLDTRFEIVLWLGGTKLRLKGEVVSKAPGFGIGVRFTSLSPESQELLRHYVQNNTVKLRSEETD